MYPVESLSVQTPPRRMLLSNCLFVVLKAIGDYLVSGKHFDAPMQHGRPSCGRHGAGMGIAEAFLPKDSVFCYVINREVAEETAVMLEDAQAAITAPLVRCLFRCRLGLGCGAR